MKQQFGGKKLSRITHVKWQLYASGSNHCKGSSAIKNSAIIDSGVQKLLAWPK